METINIDVILTFCKDKNNSSQEFFNINVSYENAGKSAKRLIERSGFFDTIVQICEDCGRLTSELVFISTAADWTNKGFKFDIGNGTWGFGRYRGENTSWSDNLADLYGFGKADDADAIEKFENDILKYYYLLKDSGAFNRAMRR